MLGLYVIGQAPIAGYQPATATVIIQRPMGRPLVMQGWLLPAAGTGQNIVAQIEGYLLPLPITGRKTQTKAENTIVPIEMNDSYL